MDFSYFAEYSLAADVLSEVSCYITKSADPSKGASLATIIIKRGGNHRGYSALNETRQIVTTGTREIRQNIHFLLCLKNTFNYCVVCLPTGPQPLPKPVLHRVRSNVSSLNFQHFLVTLRSPSSCPCFHPRLPVTHNLSFHLYSMMCSGRNLEILNYSRSPHIQPGIVRKATNTQPQTATLLIDIQNRLP